MEVQVIVGQDGGDRVEGDFKGRKNQGYTDGLTVWKPFRIPFNANSVPEDNDILMSYALDIHAEGIGCTGWNWVDKVSCWVGFDFDAIVGHSDKHSNKLTDVELQAVEEAVDNIPWVTVRRSTSGSGRHLYVFLDNIPTENHTEHAALARAILGMMSSITGFDFKSKVDVVGGNLWIWHRKMHGTDGLKLIKQGTVLQNVPANWRDHVAVVSGKRRKTLPDFANDETSFNELTGQRPRIPFDEVHKKLIAYLQENGHICDYDQDHHMIISHTYSLKEAHDALALKGVFRTTSPGTDLNTPNCFLFPMRRGAWSVRRYTPGIQEETTWDQDGAGWTRCYLNRKPDISLASRAYGGKEDSSGGFFFPKAEMAQQAAQMLGADLSLPASALIKKATLKQHKDGRLVAKVDYDAQSDAIQGGFGDWVPKGKSWERIFNVSLIEPTESEVGNFDDIVRHLVTESKEDCGWVIKSDIWQTEPLTHVTKALKVLNYSSKEVDVILGSSILKCWTLVNRPFQPEYPGDRMWNRNAAQFRFSPSENTDNLRYPTWLKVLTHVGKSLDDVLKHNAWAKINGIVTGADYLKCWIASMFQFPNEHLPYLFLYGPENSGKSILHEALSRLVTKGVNKAANALMNEQGFNAELENSVLCVIEEINLTEKRNSTALNRIKELVTSPTLSIHPKGGTPYDIPNTTHWIQVANNPSFCPVFPGDTRITVLYVDTLSPSELIPKKQLEQLLDKEAPDFLAEVLNLEIPPSHDRLNIPVIATEEKLQVQRANRTLLELFLEESCFHVTGKHIKFSEFYDTFLGFVQLAEPASMDMWTKKRVAKELPPQYPHGRITTGNLGGQWYIGNISWASRKNEEPILPRYILRGDRLILLGESDERASNNTRLPREGGA